MPSEQLSLQPTEIMQRALKSIGDHSDGLNENRLFLHFMGELLRTASAAAQQVNYEWFESVLLQFDNFKTEVEEGLSNNQAREGTTNKEFRQLGLLDN